MVSFFVAPSAPDCSNFSDPAKSIRLRSPKQYIIRPLMMMRNKTVIGLYRINKKQNKSRIFVGVQPEVLPIADK